MKRGIIIICILICGCNPKPDRNLDVIDFYSNPGTEISNLCEIATDIEYIPLQISGIWMMDIRITKNRYYIKNYSDEIECLDKNGRYLYKLSKKGIAADEYISLSDYDVTSNGELLAISTFKAVKIYKDDGTDFVFLKSIDIAKDIILPFTVRFVPGETNLLLSYHNMGTEPFINILLNTEGDTLSLRPNYHRLKKSLGLSSFIWGINYKYNNALYFKEPINDTIYTVDKSDNIKPYLLLDSQGQQVTQKIVARMESGRSKKKRWDYFNIITLWETSRYIIGLIVYKKIEFIRVFDKALNNYYSFSNSTFYIKDNVAGGVDFMPLYCDGSKLYYWISTSKLKNHVSDEGFLNSEVCNPEKKADLKKLTDSLQDPDSQVLVVVTPKE
jgi:hypothetical protein